MCKPQASFLFLFAEAERGLPVSVTAHLLYELLLALALRLSLLLPLKFRHAATRGGALPIPLSWAAAPLTPPPGLSQVLDSRRVVRIMCCHGLQTSQLINRPCAATPAVPGVIVPRRRGPPPDQAVPMHVSQRCRLRPCPIEQVRVVGLPRGKHRPCRENAIGS